MGVGRTLYPPMVTEGNRGVVMVRGVMRVSSFWYSVIITHQGGECNPFPHQECLCVALRPLGALWQPLSVHARLCAPLQVYAKMIKQR